MTQFGQDLKTWRSTRRLSQLALATECGISARHLSFLETGRARPSRGMILRLSESLSMPRSARNRMLIAAGFAPVFPDIHRDQDVMAPFEAAITRMLQNHAPFPAVVMDRMWRILEMNAPAEMLFSDLGLRSGQSLIEVMLDQNIGPQIVENWGEVGHHALTRLRAESAAAGGIPELEDAADRLTRDPDVAKFEPSIPLPPVTATIIKAGPMRLSLFSTFAQFGSAEDVTLSDLKIELMFPSNDETRLFLESLADPSQAEQ
ncbi:MAG: helix-turn-helix domain-containing protein [Pelagimonas sp.]|uniref:helix-turn-helix domain-containing protein n=1 Tax=Pelagimonas sp. TaxID=2073170 RepID=UPI003D6B12B9